SVSFIPSSVISIGKYAFYLSKELGNFKIPASINNIGSGAFVGCEDVTVESTSPYYICDIDDGGILFNIDKSIILHVPDYFGFDYSINTTEYYNEFIIPDSVVKIDNGAFYNSRLSSVTIPKTVKEIGDEAFYLCINLKRVNFQQSSELTYIGENAFQYCNIKYINLPNTLKHIGKGAIVENRIGFIKIPNTIDYKCDLSIYLDSNIRYIFTERDIPLDVEEVDKLHVFEDDSKGLRFYMHENEAFQKCILFVPNDSINIYKEKPFWRKFQYILPINKENVLVYNSEPGNLLNVLGNNFASVTNLTIKGVLNARDFKTLRDNLPILTILDIQDVIIEECWGSYEGDDDFSYNTDYKLYPSNSIPRYAFYNESTKVSNALLTSISLPKSTTKIGNHSFFNSAINSIAIPENVEIIEQFAFCGCDNLEKVYFENNKSLIHIEVCAFGNCEMLKNIIIPESVRSIDNSAFFDCKDLENVVFEKGSALTTIGKHAFYGCIKIQMIKIPSLVCDIKDCAFERCRSLEKLIFETNASIKNIGAKAFSNCINLRSIVLPSSIETIGEFAFSSCNKLTNSVQPDM
ncbi:MAG: leucine-rich repeat domain-containing protein, partial [Paludibacter sp.]